MKELHIIIAQLNFLVGDINGNAQKILQATQIARDQYQADLIVFPELALCGYLPEDLLLRADFQQQINETMVQLCQHITGIDVVLGYPEFTANKLYNAAAWIRHHKIIANYRKQSLPNYGVFDEKRYFATDNQSCIVHVKGLPIAISICEDLWCPEPIRAAELAGAQLILSINASPYESNKLQQRQAVLRQRIAETQIPIIYAQTVGGQDEVVFDGGSMVLNAQGDICQQAKFFVEDMLHVIVTVEEHNNKYIARLLNTNSALVTLSPEESVYNALVLGLRDYVHKNGFKGVLLGLSGGIDSALTLAIAVDALGAERVTAVLMPSRYTADMSNEDAIAEVKALGVNYFILPIEKPFAAFLTTLDEVFQGMPIDSTEENLQARCRGALLMALSNKLGRVVLTTGNKSEMAVGYATLYGDMAGGFAVLKDVFKTLVYRLADYRNHISPVIPQRVIDRPPSAELAPEQKDEDTLPPYDVLDDILARYLEQNQSIAEIIAAGFAASTVHKVIAMVYRNEYKRRQAAPGVKITARAFGRDRRYPITSGYNPMEHF